MVISYEKVFGSFSHIVFDNVYSIYKKFQHDYLTSAEKLLKFRDLYFDDELIKKDLQNIKTINATEKKIKIKQLKIINEQ